MGVLDTLSLGRSALASASAGVEVVSQNVANATTVGYSRRRVLSRTSTPVLKRGQWLGTGVELTGIRRATDRLLGARVVAAAGDEAKALARETVLSTAESYFEETGTSGLHEALSAMYDSFSLLTSDPSELGARREAVYAIQTLGAAVSRVATNLTGAIRDVDEAADDHLTTINANLAQIAALNRQIGKSGASLGPGDLLDQRDQLVRELGELAGATVEFAADGQATVFIGGHAAVSGREYRSLSTVVDAAGITQIHISVGAGTMRVTPSVGGELGGLFQARDTAQTWLDDLDTFATTLADTINLQHSAGFDSTGAAGGLVFTYNAIDPAASLAIDANLAADPNLLALAGAATADPGDADNLVALLDLEETGSFGGLTGGDTLSSLLSSVGSETAMAIADASTLAGQLDDLDFMRDAVSKVDVDEEAVQLVAFQAAYRAAARVVSASDELLETLMAMGA